MRISLFIFIISCLLLSCAKEEDNSIKDSAINEVEIRSGTNSTKTIIGKKRQNPFTVENYNAAFTELYSHPGNLSATHLYVEFIPVDFGELRQLVDEDISLSDYPLDHEVIQMGTTINASVSINDPGKYYAVIEVGQKSKIKFNVLAQLYLGDEDSRLIEKAYTRLGYDPEEEGYFYSDGPNQQEVLGYNPDPTNGPHYEGDLIIDANCNCKNGLNIRNPAGCITVEDNRLSNNGCTKAVRHVKVTLKNNWFTYAHVYTDKFGCFKRNKKYKGSAWMFVSFKNDQATIRGIEGAVQDAFNYALHVKQYVGKFKGPNFNNMDVCYEYPTTASGNNFRFWRASMINNGVFEFRDWANANNLPLPQDDLQFLMTPFTTTGAAPMVDKIFDHTGTVLPINNQYGGFILGLGILLNGTLFESYLSMFAPDIVINSEFVPQTDRMKSTIYHELAHAQHFRRLGYPQLSVDYWLKNINYIVDNQGYGDGTANGAERTQVIENWGWTMGPTIAHDGYGTNASGNTTHECRIEERLLVDGHIQAGWLHDIHDVANIICQDTITDNCGGYQHFKFLDVMTSDIISPSQFKNKFLITHLSPLDSYTFEDLCNEYGL